MNMKNKNLDLVVYVFIGVMSRLLPHPANFTAVGGLAVFAGTRLNLGKSIAITILTMFLSDLVLGFHGVMYATYGGMLSAVLIGKLLGRQDWLGLVRAALLSAVWFFILTNFAVWVGPQTMYPKTGAGLVECYIAALPFFRNSLIGDMVYVSVFGLIYEIVFSGKPEFCFKPDNSRENPQQRL